MKLRPETMDRLMGLRESIVGNCEVCGGIGYLDPVVVGEENPCTCMTAFLYVMELVIAEIPQRYWTLDLQSLHVKDVYKAFVAKYVDNFHRAQAHGLGIVFLGTNGVGKTSLMCEIGKSAIVRGYSVHYLTATQYVDARKGDSAIVHEYESAKVILLDELDKVYIKRGSDYVVKTLEEYLRRMLSSGRSIIICTNYDEEQFEEVFGDSTVSMIKRHNRMVSIAGDDYSDVLHDTWSELLEVDFDYFTESIMSKASQFKQHCQEVDREQWEHKLTEQDQ